MWTQLLDEAKVENLKNKAGGEAQRETGGWCLCLSSCATWASTWDSKEGAGVSMEE